MRVRISRCVADIIHAEAENSPQAEICGLLFGAAGEVTGHLSCRNVAMTPSDSFEIDPQTLIAAYREARRGGPAIVGCYHSHPSGAATPSARDAASAEANGWLWLILGQDGLGCYRAVEGGRYHGRFDAAPFDLSPVAAT